MTASTETGTPEAGSVPHRRIAMAVLLMANFMNLIDITIVNVALPSLQQDFGATSNQIEWIVAGYIFTFALMLLPAGRAGDIFGRRRLFLSGVTVFTTASALCGMAPTTEMLIVARVVQGLGGAMMTPQTMALVPVLFPLKERGAVFGLFAMAAGLASVTGPVLGGALIGADILGLGWRPIFLVNIPVGLIAILGALRYVPPVPGHRSLGIDWVGIALAGVTLFAVLFPLVEARSLGWPVWSYVLLAAALPLGLVFTRWQARQAAREAPQLLPMKLMVQRPFQISVVLAAMLFSGPPGFFFSFALYLQNGHGLTPLESGLTTMPFSVGVLLASPVSSWLGDRHLRKRVTVGALLLAGAMLLVRLVLLATPDQVIWQDLAPFLVSAGFGLGTAVSPLFQLALASADGTDSGSASGGVQAFQRVGGAFGVAIMGGLFFSRLGAAPDSAAYSAAITTAMLYPITVFVLIALGARLLPPPDRRRRREAAAGSAS